MNSAQKMPDWVLINEWGAGSMTYVDRNSIESSGENKRAWVRYYLEPPGGDRINDKQIREMLMFEEYDCSRKQVRLHRMVFRYLDGTTGEPGSPFSEWRPARGGNEITLKFLCKQIVSDGRAV
jgi:hypothetical protein